MAQTLPGATGTSDPLLSRGRRDYHLGQALLIVGFVSFVACIAWGFWGRSSGQGTQGFLIDVIGSGGFALMFAGAVFFTEGRSFLRRNKPVE
jgi:hypothetical protein